MNPAIAFALLLIVGIPLASSASAQNSTIAGNATGLVDNATDLVDNATDLVDDVTDIIEDSPFVDETSVNIVINEVELNPRGSDVGKEWIELYNPTDDDVDIGAFEIRTSFKSATIRLPSDAEIGANETYVIELDRQMLSNTAESLGLADGSGDVIDSTPSLVDKSDDSDTWQRVPDGNSEWRFVADTKGELNDPSGQISAKYNTRSGSAACHGVAGCAEGMVTRIVDGDTLYVKVNGTEYKMDLALVNAPSKDAEGYSGSTSFTRDLCLGNTVLVDQDDKLLTSDDSVIAVVYCASTNLNSELLDSGHATLDEGQCETSEFASQRWATDHGC
jgi:endonuclease YncB( thermonuclease family)